MEEENKKEVLFVNMDTENENNDTNEKSIKDNDINSNIYKIIQDINDNKIDDNEIEDNVKKDDNTIDEDRKKTDDIDIESLLGEEDDDNEVIDEEDETEEIPLVKIERYLLQWHQLSEMLYDKYSKKTLSLLTTNISGYELEEKIKDRVMLQSHNDIVFPTIEGHNGKINRSSGNMVVCSFIDSISAVRAAIDIQLKINLYNFETRDDPKRNPIKVKIGISQGQAMVDGENLYGDAVRQAAIIQFRVSPEEIFISGQVYDQIKHIKDIKCIFQKKIKIKGRRKKVDIYEIIWPKIPYETLIKSNEDLEEGYQSSEMPLTFLNSWGILAAIQAIILIFYLILK